MSKRRKPPVPQAAARQRPESIPVRILAMTALVLAFLVHAAAIWFPFVDDDQPQIVLNSHLRSWSYLPRYFTADVWSHMACGSNYYRPVFLLWLRLNHCFFELEPMGWHVAALLLHVLAAWLVYLLAARELNDRIAAGFAATIFAVHPVTVESVVWVSGATEALQGVLFLGCLLCYLKSREAVSKIPDSKVSKLWQAAAVLLFALALLNKETAIVLPLFVVIYELRNHAGKVAEIGEGSGASERATALRRGTWNGKRGTLLRLAPYIAVSAAYLVLRVHVLHGMAPGKNHVAPAIVIATWPSVLWFYVQKLIIPWPLSLDYSLGFAATIGMRNFWIPLLLLLAAGAGIWHWFRRDRRVAIACIWFLIPLLPAVAATLRFGRMQLVHDRYLYLPLIGFAMLVALALRLLPSAAGGRQRPVNGRHSETRNAAVPVKQAITLAVIVGIFGITTASYTASWSSNTALYSREVALMPDDAIAQSALAEQLFDNRQFEDALNHFRLAIAADPKYLPARLSLGHAYVHLGEMQQAVSQLRMATELSPTACTYANLGDAQRSANQLTAAEESYRHALTLHPCPPHLHWALADLLRTEGRLAEARAEYQSELTAPGEAPLPDVRRRIDELDRALQPAVSH
jgi:tetratricopeptide (TPR) repeat protein